MKNKFWPAFYGEFGWEIATIIPYQRYWSQDYDSVTCSSFEGMGYLYQDFAEFKAHNLPYTERKLEFTKRYKLETAKYVPYGIKKENGYDVLIHARNIKRKSSYNYMNFADLENPFKNHKVGFIGTKSDQYLFGDDLREIEIENLCNELISAKCTIGVSSGVMHLASFCLCPHVVWGPPLEKLFFGETLEKRYKETWNPFHTCMEYIPFIQPTIKQILTKMEVFL